MQDQGKIEEPWTLYMYLLGRGLHTCFRRFSSYLAL